MYNNQQCIALLTDRSYFVRDIGIPMNVSFGIIQNNHKNTYFIYGMNYNIDGEIEGYLDAFQVPLDHRIKFTYDKTLTSNIAISNQFLNLLQYSPDSVILFRDNPESTDTSTFVLACVRHNIPVVAIDDFGNKESLNSKILTNKFYRGAKISTPLIKNPYISLFKNNIINKEKIMIYIDCDTTLITDNDFFDLRSDINLEKWKFDGIYLLSDITLDRWTFYNDLLSDITLLNNPIHNNDISSDIALDRWTFNNDIDCDITLSSETAYFYDGTKNV